MNRYLVLYKAPSSVRERLARATPEEAMAGVQAWTDWQERWGAAVVDAGRPVGRSMTITPAGPSAATSSIVGMSVLQAEDMRSALAMVEGHHHLAWDAGCEIELLEEMAIPELSGAAQ
jgi:hypothetical protein